jgi:hypothetical protein
MEKKITKRDYFTQLLSLSQIQENPQLREFCQHELDLLVRKAENKKPTATQEANIVLMEDIYNTMEADTKYSISEMIQTFPCCDGLSTSKVSSMVTALATNGRVVRSVEKRKPYFQKVVEGV